jgi:cytochrome c biogenesis protein CcmG, thiol:disulfide interchange protein DsbE
MKYILPLVLFIVLVVFLAIGLTRDPHEIPSPLVNKAAPTFALPQLSNPQQRFKSEEMRGKVWLLNAWASWCLPCQEEHPALLQLAQSGAVPVYGLNYKDEREKALAWLDELGNPYTLIVSDTDGRVAIDYGIYGVPETFLIDRNGVIRYKQTGPLTEEIVQKKIIPLVKELQR